MPQEMRSTAFTVTVNGKPVDVAHAASSYEFVSFDVTGPVDVAVTAAEKGFWDRGVNIQPWRLGLRPLRQGQTIKFKLSGPAKLSISRPGDFINILAIVPHEISKTRSFSITILIIFLIYQNPLFQQARLQLN